MLVDLASILNAFDLLAEVVGSNDAVGNARLGCEEDARRGQQRLDIVGKQTPKYEIHGRRLTENIGRDVMGSTVEILLAG